MKNVQPRVSYKIFIFFLKGNYFLDFLVYGILSCVGRTVGITNLGDRD